MNKFLPWIAAAATIASLPATGAAAQDLPTTSSQVCSIPLTIVRRRELVPGAATIAQQEQTARTGWAEVKIALELGRGDLRSAYGKYLAERTRYARQLAPLIDDIPVSAEGAAQFLEFESMAGLFARCVEKEESRSPVADRMRRKARELSPFFAEMWRQAQAEATGDQDFAQRVRRIAYSHFASELPELAELTAAGKQRQQAGHEQRAAETRADNQREADRIHQAIEDRRLAAIREREELASRVAARAEAERRGRAQGLPVSTLAIRGLRLGSYPTSEEIEAAAGESFACPAVIPVRLSEKGTGGNRTIRAGCSALGMIGPTMSAVYTLKDYRLTEVSEALHGGDYKNCYTVDMERERTSFATRAREIERAGWHLVAKKPRENRNLFGVAVTPWQFNEYRLGNVTLELWETEEQMIETGRGCASPSFFHRSVSMRYRL